MFCFSNFLILLFFLFFFHFKKSTSTITNRLSHFLTSFLCSSLSLSFLFFIFDSAVFIGATAFNRVWCSLLHSPPSWVGKITEADFSGSKGRAYCCPTGKYYNETHSNPPSIVCTECPIGQYADQLSLDTSCTTCARDTIAPIIALPECSDCTSGKFSTEERDECKICGAGMFTFRGTTESECKYCLVGTFQDDGSPKNFVDTCTNCPMGWYQNENGKPYCIGCIPGMFQGQPGNSECSDCVEGKYQDVGSRESCTNCPMGWYQNEDGKPYCIGCIPGMFQGQPGNAACSLCPVGWDTKNSASEDLEADIAVKPETHLNDRCVRCLRGKHTNGEMGVAQCNTCPPGFLGERMTELTQGNIGGSFNSEHPAGFVCVKW